MTMRSSRLRLAAAALLASTAGLSLAATPAHAQSSAVDALLKQAEYWRSKGREDLADAALRRARQIAPDSDAVKNASRPRSTPQPAPPRTTTTRTETTPSRTAPAPSRPAPAPAANRAGNARVAGFAALDRGDLASAATQFQQAIRVNPRDGDALGGLGLVRLRQSHFAEALNLLEQASRYGRPEQWREGLASARFFAGLEHARTLMSQGSLTEAQSEAENLVRSGYPEPAPALELLAELYEKDGRYADAADLYRQASQGGTAQDERRLTARAVRGRALAAVASGDYVTAEREFQSGLLSDRDDPWIRYEFATFMIDRGRVAEAESLIGSLVMSGKPDAIYAAALLNRDLGRTNAAEKLIEQIPDAQRTTSMRNFALQLRAESAVARAKALAETGRQADALAALRQLAAVSTLPPAQKAEVAGALLDLGDAGLAQSLAEQSLEGKFATVGEYDGVIRVLTRVGRDDLARLALQRAGQLAGNSAEGQKAYARMGAALSVSQADRSRMAGRYAEAFDLLQAAWNVAPDNPDVLRALARLYQSGNMSARAAQTFQLVLVRDPRDKEALVGLAGAAQAAGDRSLSEKARDDALRAYPQDYQVRLSLAQVEQARGNDKAALRLLKEARELYTRQTGGVPSNGKPFGAMDAGGSANPFRNQALAAPAVNPFALGDGTRLGSASPTYTAAPAYAPGAPGTASYASPSYPTTGSPAQTTWPAPAASAPAGQNLAYAGDPVMSQLQADIASLSQDSGPRVDFETAYRQRSGETGLSQLDEIKGSASISTSALSGRVYARGDAIMIDSGRPEGSGLARFGRNGTIEAQAIVDEEESALVQAATQHKSGIALSAGYQSGSVKLEAGTTPIGIGETKATFSAEFSPRFSETSSARAWVERKPVTDSVVSYAGTRDPVTGELWGQVMRTGGGLAYSYDRDGSGFYAEGRYNRFAGTNVSDNEGVEANIGGYLRPYKGENSWITAGINLNYQTYANSENYFTFGLGGYFSPQSFLSISFPVRYGLKTSRLEASASLIPGYQSYSQEQTDLYPTDSDAQAELNVLKALNSDVRSYYDSLSKTGFALSADASLYYRVSPNTRIGGMASYNSFGDYSELRSMLGIRQSFGSGN